MQCGDVELVGEFILKRLKLKYTVYMCVSLCVRVCVYVCVHSNEMEIYFVIVQYSRPLPWHFVCLVTTNSVSMLHQLHRFLSCQR